MAISKRTRELVYAKYDGHCAYCGKKIDYKEMQVDHKVPLHRGDKDLPESFYYITDNYGDLVYGTDDFPNLMPACWQCNFRKGSMGLEHFHSEIRKQAKRLMETFQGRMSEQYGLIEYNDTPITFYFENYDKKGTN